MTSPLPRWWRRESRVQSHRAPLAQAFNDGADALDDAALAERLRRVGHAVVDGLLGPSGCAAVRDGVVGMERAGQLRVGKLQHGLTQTSDQTARSDRIAFLPKGAAGCSEALRRYVAMAEEIREALTEHDGLVELVGGELDGCNFMASSYPGGGARYVRHRDALPYKAGRKITAIYYLNPAWRPGDGGELQLWPEGAPPVRIAPRADRLVLFVSSLWHEVLPAWGARYALTTWMFNRRDTALEAFAEDMRQKKAAGRVDTKALLAALEADSDFDDEEEAEEEEEEGDGKTVDGKTAMAVLIKMMQQKKAKTSA